MSMIPRKRIPLTWPALTAWGASWLARLKEFLPLVFSSRTEMQVVRIEFAKRASISSIFFLRSTLEAAELTNYYLDIDKGEMRLYADVFIQTAAEKIRAEILIERLRSEGKVAKRPSMN